MSREFKKFYSKILLFGEYTIINGSQGLAIPLDKFYMKFTFEKEEFVFEKSNELLQEYSNYVVSNFDSGHYDLDKFQSDIQNGLLVSSSIPIGFGLGSSGALVASFYHEYCLVKEKYASINLLKTELGKLESYFHGASSGLDPLVSYLHQAIHIINKDEIEAININTYFNSKLQLFLLNSAIERRTAPLVEIYKSKINTDPSFESEIKKLSEFNSYIIDAYLKEDIENVKKYFQQISELQFKYMKEMIPESISGIYYSEYYLLKICGAGGGGFFLGMGDSDEINKYEKIKL